MSGPVQSPGSSSSSSTITSSPPPPDPVQQLRDGVIIRGNKQLVPPPLHPRGHEGWRVFELNEDGSLGRKLHTLTDAEVEQITDVKRKIPGWRDPIDDLVWVDANGDPVTWYGPNEWISPPAAPPSGGASPPPSSQAKSPSTQPVQPKVKGQQVQPPVPKPLSPPPVQQPVPPVPPPPVQGQPPIGKQPSPPPPPSSIVWKDELQTAVPKFNNRVTQIRQKLRQNQPISKNDAKFLRALNQYKGRRIVIGVSGEGTCAIDVTANGVTMRPAVQRGKNDLFIRFDRDEIQRILHTAKYPSKQGPDLKQVVSDVMMPKVTAKGVNTLANLYARVRGQQPAPTVDDIQNVGVQDVRFALGLLESTP
jgi:hypothetical protein